MTNTNKPSAGAHPQPAVAAQAQQPQPSILGLQVGELAGLSVDELTGNKTAITMVMHYYKQLTDENNALKNDRNTLSTYVEGYRQKKSDSRVGATLMALSNVFLGFGVNLLTADTQESPSRYGYALFICGLVMLLAGLYFTLRDGE